MNVHDPNKVVIEVRIQRDGQPDEFERLTFDNSNFKRAFDPLQPGTDQEDGRNQVHLSVGNSALRLVSKRDFS